MRVHTVGDVPKEYFSAVIQETAQLLPLPKTIEVYVLSNESKCLDLVNTFPKQIAEEFQKVCAMGKISFSFTYHTKRIVVIYLTKSNTFLLTNKNALKGLLLHEFMHIVQMKSRVYENLIETYAALYILYAKQFKQLKIKGILPIVQNIGQVALLLVKDLYANSILLEKGYGRYLASYYAAELQLKKICPKPVFYDKLKPAIKKNPALLQDLFTFELSLFSVLLPFKKYQPYKARVLIEHIENCYRLNMKELSRKCGDLVNYYLHHYEKPSKKFHKNYLILLFEKLYGLLDGDSRKTI